MGHMGGMDMGMWVMWGGMVLPLLALIGVAVWAVLRFTGRRSQGDAKRILEERLARGEIGTDEFERLRSVLGGAET
ncbi:MAG: SHOCT domain-containing protein [Actinomycetota bacterium]